MGFIGGSSRFSVRCSVLTLGLVVAASAACSSSKSSTNDAATGSGGSGSGGRGSGGSGSGGSGSGGSASGGSASGGSSGGGSPGGGGRGVAGAAGGGSGQTLLTVTSTAFNEGETVPAENTCAGANLSPPLTWTAGPSGTMSYAVTLTDMNNSTIHWVIWDIAGATHALPAALAHDAALTTPPGAKQAHHVPFFGAADNGYRGPCPSGMLHNYQFEVHALDVATLPTVTTASTPIEVKAQLTIHSLAHGDLVGTSTASAAGQ